MYWIVVWPIAVNDGEMYRLQPDIDVKRLTLVVNNRLIAWDI